MKTGLLIVKKTNIKAIISFVCNIVMKTGHLIVNYSFNRAMDMPTDQVLPGQPMQPVTPVEPPQSAQKQSVQQVSWMA